LSSSLDGTVIDTAIKLHDKLLIVLTEHSMQSNWVRTEIRKARQRRGEGKPATLVPDSPGVN